jgi:hypothetical protein
MDSELGDILERHIKTWKQAVRELRAAKHLYADDFICTGVATDGMLCLHHKSAYDLAWSSQDNAHTLITIYECTGEQSCPLDDCD